MFATRFQPLKSVVANPLTKSLVLRNAAAASVGARAISATPKNEFYETEQLKTQRPKRPLSPHILIYQQQITWSLSGAHRVMGGVMGATTYAGVLAYLTLPYVGYSFDSASIVALVAPLPVAAKLAAKVTLATPFVYHCVNGVRHLLWDAGFFLTMKGIYQSAYAMLATTAVGVAYLVSQ